MSFATTLVFAAACERDDPLTPNLDAASYSSDRPFYYHQHDPVYLTVDPTRMVVASSETSPLSAARAILQDLGVTIQSATPLPQAQGHFVLRVSATGPDAVIAAAARLRARSNFGFATPAYKGEHEIGEALLINRVNVRFDDATTRRQIDSIVGAIRGAIVREPADTGQPTYWIAYPPDSAVDPLQIAALLDQHPLVAWADPDKVSDRRRWSPPTDPYYSYQWHLKNPITRNGISVDDSVEAAWTLTTGVAAIRVSVIDDGIDANHPDICGLAGGVGYDPAFQQPGDNVYVPFGSDNHGTQVAGLITACQNNSVGVAGIAPGITHFPVRIFRGDNVATDAQIADGLHWAWHQAWADVLSNSWGGGLPSNAITAEINAANFYGRFGKGAIVVFAAGNTSNRDGIGFCGQPVCGLTYPATLSSVIAVGAINRTGELTNYTPEGPELDIVAPSGHYTGICLGEIVTTDRVGSVGCNSGPNGDHNYSSEFSGTSAATPQVAAVAALLFSREPDLFGSYARTRILTGADSWGSATQFGAGKLNGDRVLWPYAPVGGFISGPQQITVKATYTWEAMPSGGSGNYAYAWEVYFYDSGTTVSLGTAKTQKRTVFQTDGDFEMRVGVTSAGRGTTLALYVEECIGCGP